MPTTSTAINACGCTILIDDEAGTLTDISGSANNATLDFKNDLGEYKVFGDANKYRMECGMDASVDLEIIYTSASKEAMDILKRWRQTRGDRTVQIRVPSSGDLWQGEFKLESLSLPFKADEAKPIMVKAKLLPNGAVDWSTLPA